MKKLALSLSSIALSCLFASSAWSAGLKVGVIASRSGPASSIGIPVTKGIQAGETFRPQALGQPVEVIVLDDASDPTAAARNARKLIEVDKVDVLIAGSSVATLLSAAGVARDSKTAIIAPIAFGEGNGLGAIAAAQPLTLMVNAVVDHMKQTGIKTVGFIGFSDTWGDFTYAALIKATASAGIKVVANERYARADTSVTSQVLKVMATKPDAVMTGVSGAAGALPYLSLSERGYKGALYGTHALANADFIRLVGASAQGVIVPSGPVVVADQLPESNPIKKVSFEFLDAYKRANKETNSDAYAPYAFDAWLIVQDAAARVGTKAQPGTPAFRQALMTAIQETKELVGTHGVYNFKPGLEYGLDQRGSVLLQLDKGRWKLLKS